MTDPAYLHECFVYNPKTGILKWKPRPREHFATEHGWRIFQGKHAGKPAGTTSYCYVRVKINQQHTDYAHRIIWAMQTGEWPKEIDHKDRNKLNNRWSNLRLATRQENTRNHARPHRALPKGVTALRKGYVAQATIDRRSIRIGSFETPEEAHAAYCAFVADRHGAFFCKE